MAKVLRLYNTFTKTLNNVELNGKLITSQLKNNNNLPIDSSLYICGPTVYSDCHVGHALTYIRADLFKRFMRSLFNVRLNTVMNITDIDDKILTKAKEVFPSEVNTTDPNGHAFRKISDKYYYSFLKDMETINVQPADMYVNVSKHINLIVNFIQKLELNGHTYHSKNGDIHFRVNSIKNYKGRIDDRLKNDHEIKNDIRDFVLWKAAKPNEPVWEYKSLTDETLVVPGRPGWHVQCSAISSSVFGKKLDFHFGGQDLVFPHHYNEEACCCAYHQLDTSSTLHVWANNWLHSGHLVLKDSKMSKSLGNVIAINSFIGRSSVNALRLLCIETHYRSDVQFNEDLLSRLKALDHKINALNSFLIEELRNRQESLSNVNNEEDFLDGNTDMENAINITQENIIDGVCDDFHLDRGLDSILDLSKLIYSKDIRTLRSRDLIIIWSILREWCSICGLKYRSLDGDNHLSQDEILLNLLLNFRKRVRDLTLSEYKNNSRDKSSLDFLMQECDKIRSELDEMGFVSRDGKFQG